MNDLFYHFLYCLQPAMRNKIQIFSLDSDHDLDDTIFKAIIQGIPFVRRRSNEVRCIFLTFVSFIYL